ncbi:MAG: hypothetical protein CMJ20_00805 [Phycisphaeraceae bacterium]|nr:hypothetical protein [Phycisphaeraceae bacterium]
MPGPITLAAEYEFEWWWDPCELGLLRFGLHDAGDGLETKIQGGYGSLVACGRKNVCFVAAGSDAESHYTAFVQCEDDVVISIERGEFPSSQTDMAWQIMGADASLCLPMRRTNDRKDEVILNQFRPGDGVVRKSI